jgi:hypothetical protein
MVLFADYGSVNFTILTTSLSSWALNEQRELANHPDGVVVETVSTPARSTSTPEATGASA